MNSKNEYKPKLGVPCQWLVASLASGGTQWSEPITPELITDRQIISIDRKGYADSISLTHIFREYDATIEMRNELAEMIDPERESHCMAEEILNAGYTKISPVYLTRMRELVRQAIDCGVSPEVLSSRLYKMFSPMIIDDRLEDHDFE